MKRRNYLIPSDFADRIRWQLPEEAPALIAALESTPATAVRLHPHKGRRDDFPPAAEPIPWAPEEGLYLPDRPRFAFDPLWYAGAYYVQEPSSMFLPYLIEWHEGMRVLDLAAAPGGKSTHLLSYLERQDGLLVSNEPEGKRYPALVENLQRWGLGRHVTTRLWPRQWEAFGEVFDVVVVDAPCSGEGMFRKLPAARTEWSPGRIRACSRTQREILRHAAKLVRPGGLLIYSTCTFSVEENEAQAKALYAEYGGVFAPHFKEVPSRWGIKVEMAPTARGPQPFYKFYPHRLKGEGLAVTAFRKTDTLKPTSRKPLKKSTFRPMACPAEWAAPSGWACVEREKDIRTVPTTHLDFIGRLPLSGSSLVGLGLAQRRGRKLLPHPEWALSSPAYQKHDFPVLSLSHGQALQYLKGAPLRLSLKEKGWLLLAFRARILGWGKALPNGRINNYYPPKWRLRQSPEGWQETSGP